MRFGGTWQAEPWRDESLFAECCYEGPCWAMPVPIPSTASMVQGGTSLSCESPLIERVLLRRRTIGCRGLRMQLYVQDEDWDARVAPALELLGLALKLLDLVADAEYGSGIRPCTYCCGTGTEMCPRCRGVKFVRPEV